MFNLQLFTFELLNRYERKRRIRVSVVHAVARMASKMVTTYQPYLDFGSSPLCVSLAFLYSFDLKKSLWMFSFWCF